MDDPRFFLEGVVKNKDETEDFEGPLSLILMLLNKNKIEIRDVKISDILDQYLDYLDKMQSIDLELASEFVQMAAHLLYIKTKTLLTGEEEVSELEALMESLEQLKCRDTLASIRELTPELKKASELGMLYYSKQPEPEPDQIKLYGYRHKPVELLLSLYGVYSRGGKTPDLTELGATIPPKLIYSVRDKSRQLIEQLKTKGSSLGQLYQHCGSKSEIVATFISILELCSLGSLLIYRKNEDYCVRFTGGNVDEIIEKIAE